MKKMIINENQKGFLFKNGKYKGMLGAGKYYLYGGREIQITPLSGWLVSGNCSLETLLSDPEVRSKVSVVEVSDAEYALHYVNGQLSTVTPLLGRGKYAFWQIEDVHTYQMIDTTNPMANDSIPIYMFQYIPSVFYTKMEVQAHEKAALYYNGRFEQLLDAGTYYFWKTAVKVEAKTVDTRLQQMNIQGQEMLTLDKVALRINFVCHYRVTEYVRVLTEIDDYREHMHVAAQLALREYVGKYKLDEILENKDQMSQYVLKSLQEKEKELFVQIMDAGVKDIILPGEIREIMNTVLIAEKRAQANVITRREEVASTRSLLNTARLMDENRTLYKLKELEYIERICENVGNITLNSGGDVLSQLTGILKRKDESA
ncbi:MAG: slipin family protein [Ruminococcaceae bacterium]|nr:slipin family protein [Oscillospiraceae bacterium]